MNQIKSTDHGCCPDKFTPAEGPNHKGCPCHTYEYGCCADGIAVARGPGQVGDAQSFVHLKRT